VGIYDATGRLPLPSDEAIAVKRLDEKIRVVNLTPALIPWPARNPSAFYINGAYHAKLPVGKYDLIVAKGPEYRFAHRIFNVRKDRIQAINIKLQRWANLPAKGWYSGDNHIHYIRHSQADDPNLLIFTQAEDLHVANILQMGNIAGVHWPQYGWTPVESALDDTYSFVPGQEDPRTQHHGHIISLRLNHPIRDPKRYLLYHEVFEKARAQGGVTGYAHAVGEGGFNARGGMTLDIPFGLVDFVEVMQFGSGGSSIWFDFLNLGYKLAPSAGTDYMWDYTLPGAERSYVHVPTPFTLQTWFDGLKRGRTFVTNGPMLEFTVNGQGMGSELRLKSGDKLTIEASASINPDIDVLSGLDLIEQGEVVKSVTAQSSSKTKLQLHYEVPVRHGTWFVVRARGQRPYEVDPVIWEAHQGSAKIAFSGAVYVYVDEEGFWKPSVVSSIVEELKKDMKLLLTPDAGEEMGNSATRELSIRLWDPQENILRQRINEVTLLYDRLVERAKMSIGRRAAQAPENGKH